MLRQFPSIQEHQNMTRLFLRGALAVVLIPLLIASASASWQPPGPIKLMIAFAAGGGADTQARLIAEALEQEKGWKFIPENVTGKGGINLLSALKGQPNDGTVIGIAVTESLGYNLLAAKNSGLAIDDFTALTTTAGFQMGVVAKTSQGFKSFEDVVAAANAGRAIRFGVMSPRLEDIAYLLGKKHGVEFNTVMLRGGKAVMNALNAGDVDIGWGAGIQTKAVLAGDMVNLASGLKTPLKISPDAPTMADLGLEYDAGGHFLFVAPAGLSDDARTALADAIASVASNPDTKAGGLLNKAFGGAVIVKGAELDQLIVDGYAASESLIKAASE